MNIIRTITAATAGLVLCTVLVGCGGGSGDDDMTKRRDEPREKRQPPGAAADTELDMDKEGEPPAGD